MMLTFRVRACPTIRQHRLFADYLDHTRQLYNAALGERIDCYQKTGRSIGNAEQARGLTQLRCETFYARYPRRLARWAINLVDTSYRGMFARHKNGDKLGPPRFRGRDRWSTIGWDSPIDFTMRPRGLYGKKSFGGTLRLAFDRELPPWTECKAITLSRDGDRWFANLTYQMPDVVPKEQPKRPVGIDVGLIELAVRSDGVPMDAERVSPDAVAEQRRTSRALSRCRGRSKRRGRVKARLSKLHGKIAARRKAILHRISARLTHHFDAVAVEDLNLKGLNKSGGAGAQGRGVRKSWQDRAPGMLFDMIEWKSKRDGRKFERVNPRRTTIDCADCGAEVRKKLRERMHVCECGAVRGRDHNAALNILARAGWGPGVVKPGVRSSASASFGAGLALKHGKSGRITESMAARKRSRKTPSISLSVGKHTSGRARRA